MPFPGEKWTVRRNRLKSSFEALYRDVAAFFGLPPSIVWILYTLMDAEGNLRSETWARNGVFPNKPSTPPFTTSAGTAI